MECVELAAQSIAAEMIRAARTAPVNEPVTFVTGNSFVPALRSFDRAEAIWRYDGTHGTFLFEELVERLEQVLAEANVLLAAPEYDNSLYVVDLARFEYVEDAEGDSLSAEWRKLDDR